MYVHMYVYMYKIIEHNIAYHLLLDVGIILRQITVTTMRYDQTSKYFWLLVQKLFNVKDMYTRSFQGNNGKGLPRDMTV